MGIYLKYKVIEALERRYHAFLRLSDLALGGVVEASLGFYKNMPFRDGTGPLGQGPMTGRGLGYCAGFNRAGYAYPGRGRGWFGRGQGWFGRGQGWRNYGYPAYFPAQPTAKEERGILEEEVKALREELEDLETRLQELKTKKGK